VLTAEDQTPVAADANPYLATGIFAIGELTLEALRKLARTEFDGETLYDGWAASIGKEETDHGNRLLQAAALLEGGRARPNPAPDKQTGESVPIPRLPRTAPGAG